MSGEFDTAFGNTLLNYCVIKYVIGTINAQLMIDGDDSVLIMESNMLPKFKTQFHLFAKFGFKTKCEVVFERHQVEYCQSFYVDAPTPFFCRNPIKVISNLCISTKQFQGRAAQRYMAGVAMGELHVNSGIPILDPILRKLLMRNPIVDDDVRYKLTLDAMDIDLEKSRAAMFETFGITAGEQMELEKTNFTPVLNGLRAVQADHLLAIFKTN